MIHRFRAPRSFAGNRSNIEIYTDARARDPLETDVINGESGVGIRGILVINGKLCEYDPMGTDDAIAHWVKGVKSLHRLISFLELLCTYVGICLWTADRLCNTDLMRSAIPIATVTISFWGNGTQRLAPPLGGYNKRMSVS